MVDVFKRIALDKQQIRPQTFLYLSTIREIETFRRQYRSRPQRLGGREAAFVDEERQLVMC